MQINKSNSHKELSFKSDIELVLEYKESFDNEVIGELYTRYNHIVFGISLKYLKDTDDAQDALLEVFNNLFEYLIKYQIDDFKSWLLTVTRNYCLKFLKEKSKHTPIEYAHIQSLSVDFMENEQQIDHHNEKEKQYKQLEYAITKLKPKQQQCISLFYLEDKSYYEISENTGYPIKKVKSYIQNGKRNLQLLMNQK